MIVAIVLIILIVVLVVILFVAMIIYAEKDDESEWIYLPFHKKLRILGLNPPDYARVMADKVRAKEIAFTRCPDVKVAKIVWCSSEYHIPILDSILEKDKKYIMKSNNASARNAIITSKSNRASLENTARRWLREPYNITTEKFYSEIKPQIFIEEMIEIDYELRIFCFHGIPRYMRYRKGDCISYYNDRWEKIDLTQYYCKTCNYVDIRDDRVIETAKKLSDGIAFVCVDLMIDKDKQIYFGEYTFCPNNSARTFVPDRYQQIFSDLWKFND